MRRRTLQPAKDLAAKANTHHPNESSECRQARTALLAEKIELRRHIECIAQKRPALLLGGEVSKEYSFDGDVGSVTLHDLFGHEDTLVFFMYGSDRAEGCSICTLRTCGKGCG